MTNKERFAACMRGEKLDRVPLLIFSELLPPDIYESLIKPAGGGLIVHAGSVSEGRNRVRESNEYEDGVRTQTLHTTKGDLRARYRTGLYDLSGSGEIQTEWFVKEESDYPAMIEAIEDVCFHLDDASYRQTVRELGADGVTHTWTFEPPYMGMQYLLGYENWALHQYDYPDRFAALMRALGDMQDRRMRLQAQAPEKDLINLGNLAGNYAPSAFQKHVMPYFERYGALLKAAGCSTTVHADALNLAAHRKVFDVSQVDVIEAFTPPPVGDLTLAEARRAWGDEVVFHINIPEAIFFEGARFCRDWTRALLKSDPNPRKFLSFTELGFMGPSGASREAFVAGMRGVLEAINE